MKIHPLNRSNWLYVALAAIAVGLIFVAPFLGIIALAALMAFLFYGVYTRLHRSRGVALSATLTFLWSLVVVLLPILFILIFSMIQFSSLAAEITAAFTANGQYTIPQGFQALIDRVNALIEPVLGVSPAVTGEGVGEYLSTAIPEFLKAVTLFIGGFVSNLPIAIIHSVLYVILFFEFVIYGKKIIEMVVSLSPFEPDISRMYLARIGLMANAMAKAQLLISFIISLLSAIILTVFMGLGEYFFLMVLLFTILNLIPLGCGVIVIPITLIGMVVGPFWPSLIAFVLYLIVSNLDDYIRPKIIPKSITLSVGLTMLGAIGGVALYGLIGVVYGPIIMIVLVTSVEMYLDYYRQLKPKRSRKPRLTRKA